MIIELSQDECSQCAYALNELANRRSEQAIDMRMPHASDEAKDLRTLADRFRFKDSRVQPGA